jgi:glycosyltransferase involved in cell wall biosynthesis
MRFCMVTNYYPPFHFGGDATYVRALSRALVARGHEVEIVHCLDAYRLCGRRTVPKTNTDDGIKVHRLHSRLGFLSPLITQQTGHPGLKRKALRAILARGFDVVNFHNISLVGGPAVLHLAQAPVILYTLHEHWLLCPTHVFWKNRSRPCDRPTCLSCCVLSGIPPQLWRYTSLARSAVARADSLIAPSEFTARLHRAAGFATPIIVLPLFSVLQPPRPSNRPRPARPSFLFIGRVTASKGLAPLLEQFARLPDYNLLIVGDGDLRAGLESQYAGSPNIRFLGPLPQAELIHLYEAAIALIFPSLAVETFGLSVVEAFACGTPAIVRDAGGCREIVEASGAGFVYRTPDELVSAIRALAETPNLRQELGQRALETYRRLYTEERHVSDYLRCIDDIRRAKGLTVQ